MIVSIYNPLYNQQLLFDIENTNSADHQHILFKKSHFYVCKIHYLILQAVTNICRHAFTALEKIWKPFLLTYIYHQLYAKKRNASQTGVDILIWKTLLWSFRFHMAHQLCHICTSRHLHLSMNFSLYFLMINYTYINFP